MGILANIKAKFGGQEAPAPGLNMDGANIERADSNIMKSHIPNFLYKPPFGYARTVNIPLIRKLAKNGYVFSVIQTITDQISSTDWNIKVKEGYEGVSEEALKKVRDWFYNPNPEHESFNQILKQLVTDILEIDSGVLVKVFDKGGNFKAIYARDGSTFLKNPDVYGSIANREDFIAPANMDQFQNVKTNNIQASNMYKTLFGECAAYYQYGWTMGAYPIPFGKREIVYLARNPRTDTIYGRSPIEILGEILYTLIYGSNYNLDYYINNNMPEGVFSLIGANQATITQFKKRLEQQFRKKDGFDNMRKQFFKYPVTSMDAKFLPFQLKPLDMAIVEQQQWFIKLFWACFGITPSEMGFTEDSNRATEHGQNVVVKRKVLKPLLTLLEYHINTQIITEFGIEGIEFKFDDYDLEDDIKRHSLLQMQINMGLKTAEMIAEEEGIDVERLKAEKEEARQQQMEEFSARNPMNNQAPQEKKEDKKEDKKETKSRPKDVFGEIEEYIQETGKRLATAIEKPLNRI